MESTERDWYVGTQKVEAGNTWLEPNQIKINTLSSQLLANSRNSNTISYLCVLDTRDSKKKTKKKTKPKTNPKQQSKWEGNTE